MKNRRNEKGFLSGFIMLFVVTLALMGVGGAILMNSEGRGLGTTHEAMQANYAVDSAMWLTIAAFNKGTEVVLQNQVPFTIGGATISQIDTSENTATNTITVLITANTKNTSRMIQAELQSNPGLYGITSTGNVKGMDIYDANGQEDPDLIEANKDELPDVNVANFINMANNQTTGGQAHFINGNITSTQGWPNGSFYNANGNPNVTYINGDLTVKFGHTIYGIFIVTGDVIIEDRGQVRGFMYTPNSGSSFTLNGPRWKDSVKGGIMSECDIDGEFWFDIFDSRMTYNPEYVKSFMKYGDINLPDRHKTQSYSYIPDEYYY